MKSKIAKVFLGIGIICLVAIISTWSFNHINPWVGISLCLIGLFLVSISKPVVKILKELFPLLAMVAVMSSCSRVAPNYYGVLMEDYGKNGKSDYSKQQGKVVTVWLGTELFQVPAFDQRGDFGKRPLELKAADNTEFSSTPLYSYRALESRVVDLVFQNSRLGSGKEFMETLEDNVLEPLINDIIKEESRRFSTDTLMANGGSLRFEKNVQKLVKKAFEDKGLELITFSCNLDFSDKVKSKIDSRNEVNTNISVLDQQIAEQKKRNELAELKAQENLIISRGITQQLLQQQFIEKWDGKTPLYGTMPISLLKTN